MGYSICPGAGLNVFIMVVVENFGLAFEWK